MFMTRKTIIDLINIYIKRVLIMIIFITDKALRIFDLPFKHWERNQLFCLSSLHPF